MAPRKKAKAKGDAADAPAKAKAPAAKATAAKKAAEAAAAAAEPKQAETGIQTEDIANEAGTPDWILERRAVNRMAQAKRRAAQGSTTSPSERERQRLKWQKYKQEYNKQRRSRTAEAKEALGPAAKPRGRPANPPIVPPENPNISNSKLVAALKKAAQAPNIDQYDAIEVPEGFQDMLGKEIELPKDETKLPAIHLESFWSLEPETQDQYVNTYLNALRLGGYNIPKDAKQTQSPLQLAKLLIELPVDPWRVIEGCIDPSRVSSRGPTKGQPVSNATLNGDARGLLGMSSLLVRHMFEEDMTEGRQWYLAKQLNCIFQAYNAIFKGRASAQHGKQTSSASAKANLMPWPTWEAAANKFIKDNTRPNVSVEKLRNAVILALYTWQPPTRLQNAIVEVVNAVPAKRSQGNYIYDDGKSLRFYYGKFKNKKSFGKELPLECPVENPALAALLRRYLKMLKGTALFPKPGDANESMGAANFGKLIGDLAESLTGKRFTVQKMRVSYITNWHSKNRDPEGLDLDKTKVLMRSMLQTNVAVHMGYSKRNVEELFQKQAKSIGNEKDTI